MPPSVAPAGSPVAPPPAPVQPSGPEYDVFVSYAEADEPWCDDVLLPPMRNAGLRVIDRKEFVGKYKVTAIAEAVEGSRHTVLVISRGWLKDQWGRFEGVIGQSALFKGRLVLLLREKDLPEIPLHLRDLEPLDYSDPDRRQERMVQLLGILGRTSRQVDVATTQRVIDSLRALAELMQVGSIQEVVARYEESFRDAAAQIEEIGHFKQVHDDFQLAEGSFWLVVERQPTLPDGEAPVAISTALRESTYELIDRLDQLLGSAEKSGLPPARIRWEKPVRRLRDDLDAGVKTDSARHLAGPLERFHRALGTHPREINQAIVECARTLSLARVASELERVRDHLMRTHSFADGALARLQRLSAGISPVRELGERLAAGINNHDQLQQVDDAFRQFDGDRQAELRVVADVWEDVKDPVGGLNPAAGAEWVPTLTKLAGLLGASLVRIPTDPGAVRDIQQLVVDFRRATHKAFNRADRDLLHLCGQLRKVGDELRDVIREMQHVDD
ncbi:MAG TPA: toll/interleukin-1 receptor domain-containing protein [Gemmataceae bacterium]|nr:toll/interleukin-1 receptor domain-containing protein [Gemmataceae bacterium]